MTVTAPSQILTKTPKKKPQPQQEYAQQSERLGLFTASQSQNNDDTTGDTSAVKAKFITPQDPVIETADGGRLPAVPLEEAVKLNKLRNKVRRNPTNQSIPEHSDVRQAKDGTVHGAKLEHIGADDKESEADSSLQKSMPPSHTNPLFPPLPLYGPPSLHRSVQCYFFRFTSFFLSLAFLLVIILGATFTGIPVVLNWLWMRATFRDPNSIRPFYKEEKVRRKARQREEHEWTKNKQRRGTRSPSSAERDVSDEKKPEFEPAEGGPDPLICDVSYYARREGLDIETFQVQTEDGFIIELQHIYNPLTDQPSPAATRQPHSPTVFQSERHASPSRKSPHRESPNGRPPIDALPTRYPVLLLHGLLQSSGAYCCTGSSSLAFYLAKAGYDVWLGNNRCGFEPRHTLLEYADPRMWSWNIRQMGVLDLSALVSRVLSQTGSPKLALVAHSQGTTQTLVALAKEQRPELGEKLSVFCALAPAAYAGPLIGKAYFKFMRVITPGMFRCIFGIHSFIPFMMTMHKLLPGRFYGDMGYLVFSFLFNWSDTRWDRGLRARCFQFAPTFVSAESMRWWLGRECFAKQKCILATRNEGRLEDEEDEEEDEIIRQYYEGGRNTSMELERGNDEKRDEFEQSLLSKIDREERGKYAWYDESFPPLALWVAGADDLVDGRRLLRRFDRGREPHVRVVHKKIIEGYEHLDVIWAMDSIEKVGSEVKDVIWRTMPKDLRGSCPAPDGCKNLEAYDLDTKDPRKPEMVLEGIHGNGTIKQSSDAKKRCHHEFKDDLPGEQNGGGQQQTAKHMHRIYSI
ncbi:alpha/beta-hydrolase [Myriangium duriaei CBS 260.36]|uniref:Alpha/beta-hydrolase n=1 Tax=Myriangium duriaei CBS 260.36 TaxID=1168546 RepID=A0A9P4IS99_9PEZI|nr:alpha/beta-hydrolase [Myriangium duriaei CBS 260.36]